VDDPIFGLVAYGGDLERRNGTIRVIPRDGVRARFHVLRGPQRMHLILDRDGFALGQPVVFNNDLSRIAFVLENRAGDGHESEIRLAGLPSGAYQVRTRKRLVKRLISRKGEDQEITIHVDPGTTPVAITRDKPSKPTPRDVSQ